MTIEMRGRGTGGLIAAAVTLAVIVLFLFAWIDAGREPARDIVISVPVPGLSR